MNAYLVDIARLVEEEDGDFSLRVERGHVRATWKSRKHKDAVASWHPDDKRYPGTEVTSVLRALLQRLGYAHLPTTDNFVDKMNPRQRERFTELVKQVQQLRREVFDGVADACEPRLRAPRSGLHPELAGASDVYEGLHLPRTQEAE